MFLFHDTQLHLKTSSFLSSWVTHQLVCDLCSAGNHHSAAHWLVNRLPLVYKQTASLKTLTLGALIRILLSDVRVLLHQNVTKRILNETFCATLVLLCWVCSINN